MNKFVPHPLLISILLFPIFSFAQVPHLDLGDPPIAGQFTSYGAAGGGGETGLPMATGDYNGDGFLDLAHSPLLADPVVNNLPRTNAGLVYVAFGNGVISGFVDFANPPDESLIVYGARQSDFTGNEIWTGDVNGDEIDDLLVCAQDTDGPSGTRTGAGSVYIIFGSETLQGNIDLLNPPPGVVQIHGAEVEDRLGIWIRAADFNGDEIDDLIVGADGGDGPNNSRTNSGCAYIIYGGEDWPLSMDLVARPPDRTILFHGIDNNDRFGATVNAADINGDGRMDALISAGFLRSGAGEGGGPASGGGDGPGNNRTNAGESFIFFNPGEWPAEIDAANPPGSVSMTIAYGESSSDFFGEEALGGDLNQDGFDEWIVGAFPALNNRGKGYVIQGGEHLENREIDLLNPPGDIISSEIIGIGVGDIAADTMIVGDVDKDTFPDLMVGSPHWDAGGSSGFDVGRVDVLFGGPDPFPQSISLSNPPSTLRTVYIAGPDRGDILCYSMSVGDWDKDGYADPMPNAMRGDGAGNAISGTGDGIVVSGKVLSELAPSFTPTPGPALFRVR